MNTDERDGEQSAPRPVRRAGALTLTVMLGAGLVAGTSCSSMNNTERGATAGAGAGAVVGGVIGNQTGSTAKGAIIGAVVGGAAGAIIGRQMDKHAEELEEELENARVERVAEGIQVTFDSGILFDFDSDRLRPASEANLRELAESLGTYPDTDVLVVGHTDAVGDESYNEDLSRRRARAAKRFLEAQGVAADRIQAEGLGETEPVASNETETGRQENRRVEVAIFASEEYREEMERRHGGGTPGGAS